MDHYATCPCGSGKKIKFCCSNDLLPELDRIQRLASSKQLVAAVEQINHVMATKGRRPALLALKGEYQIHALDLDGANATSLEWLERNSRHLPALSMATIVSALRGDLAGAIERYSRVFEYAESSAIALIHTYQAAKVIGEHLLADGNFAAAYRYLSLARVGAEQMEDDRLARGLNQIAQQINQSKEFPVVIKQIRPLRDCPETVFWREDFQAAKSLAERNAIWKACEVFEALASRFSSQPSILWNLAVLRLHLGNRHLASLAWRTFAALPSISADEALEALMIAEYLEPRNPDMVDVVVQEYQLSETSGVTERFLSDRHCISIREITDDWDTENDGPPPKAAFLITNKPCRDTEQVEPWTELPQVVGRVYVFGRQTDRGAYLEFLSRTPEHLPFTHELLRKLCGDSLADVGPLRVVGQTPLLIKLAHPELLHFTLNAGNPLAEQPNAAELEKKRIRENVLEIWPQTPLKALDGKTPLEAVHDPVLLLRLSAIVALFEQRDLNRDLPTLIDELRERVGLPPEPSFGGPDLELDNLPLFRLNRVEPKALSNDQLFKMIAYAYRYNLSPANYRAATEVLDRPGFEPETAKILAYQIMATNSASWADVEKYLDPLIAIFKAKGESFAHALLLKTRFALVMGMAKQAVSLISELQSKYAGDEQTQERLFELISPYMQQLPDGRMSLRLPSHGERGAAQVAAAAKPSGLWTPDQGPPTAAVAASGSNLSGASVAVSSVAGSSAAGSSAGASQPTPANR
jgi:tetratricopeptide (TPR) repeat protein